MIDLVKFEESILKTGFALENYVLKVLKLHGWSTISNKYYVDDSESAVREIDLIAYKVRLLNKVRLYTVLIISCKKNESNCWALLTRSLDKKDPNKNFIPIHAWSNSKPISFQMNLKEFSQDYYEEAQKFGIKHICVPDFEIFAFQEMNKSSGVTQNDKAIFQSITSLMKAQFYELDTLTKRKKEECIFQFSLVNILDTDLLRIDFDQDSPKASLIDDAIHLNTYIINKKEETSRIHFITKGTFELLIEDYNRLNNFNYIFFKKQNLLFYDGIIKNTKKHKILRDDFFKMIETPLKRICLREFKCYPKIHSTSLDWIDEENRLKVLIDFSKFSACNLNESKAAKKLFSHALIDIYKYDGDFEFDEDDPF